MFVSALSIKGDPYNGVFSSKHLGVWCNAFAFKDFLHYGTQEQRTLITWFPSPLSPPPKMVDV
jgi:hypothetical protein